MAVNKVDLYVSQILEDLNNGLTWLKKDDVGYGSIQEKYNAKDQQITMIRKHPKLKDAETSIIVFTVIDDTNEGDTSLSVEQSSDAQPLESVSGTSGQSNHEQSRPAVLPAVSDEVIRSRDAIAAAELDAFANI